VASVDNLSEGPGNSQSERQQESNLLVPLVRSEVSVCNHLITEAWVGKVTFTFYFIYSFYLSSAFLISSLFLSFFFSILFLFLPFFDLFRFRQSSVFFSYFYPLILEHTPLILETLQNCTYSSQQF